MLKSRKPNQLEKSDLAYYVANEMGGWEANDHLDQALGLVKNAAIAVFDDYISDSPGYVGKVMTVVWPTGPELYEVFIWRDGEIIPVAQDPQFQVQEQRCNLTAGWNSQAQARQ